MMKKNVLLYILLVFLIAMNGFFLVKHFGKSEQKELRGPGPGNFIATQLDFDAAQLQQFEKMDAEHREKIKDLLGDIRASKDVLFDKASDSTVNESEIDAIVTEIANKEKAKELETFRFFKAVVELCNENQKERFRSIIKDALRRQGPQGRKRPPGGRPEDGHRPPPPEH